MKVHLEDDFNENGTFCNTKSKKVTTNKKEVTCKRCLYYKESERLLNLHEKYEGDIIASDIKDQKTLF